MHKSLRKHIRSLKTKANVLPFAPQRLSRVCLLSSRGLLAFSLLSFFVVASLDAQSLSKGKVEELTPSQLIEDYRFEDAANLLEKQIKAAQKKGIETEELEAELHRANLGRDLLEATQRVTFIDSLVVPLSQVLPALRLSSQAGTLIPTGFPDGEEPGGQSRVSSLSRHFSNFGKAAFINELKDKILFSASDSLSAPKTLYAAYKMATGWEDVTPLEGLSEEGDDIDFPFMLPDGITLYYSSLSKEGLGGYDLYVTRFNSELNQFLKPENLGMPFNSPANDYLLAIDEEHGLGWLVTDRNQPTDTVCVYVFLPADSYEYFTLSDENLSEVIRAARIDSLAESQTDPAIVKEGKAKLAQAHRQSLHPSTSYRRYIINDELVYTDLSQFRSDAARRIAAQADEVKAKVDELEARQAELQAQAAKGNRTKEVLNSLLQIEKTLPELRTQLLTLCKNFRKAELQ